MGTHDPAVLRRLLDIALALGAVRGTEAVLQTILEAARELTGARFAAVGVPDGSGGFALFLTAGVDEQTWERIGALPRTHGVLGIMLGDPDPLRLPDIRRHPDFTGWPAAHPVMRAFLGVPIVAGGDVVAALYLTDPTSAGEFDDSDQEVVEALAAHAALAVVNAQRHERSRELSIAEERTRLARDLHDSVTQTLFSLTLSAETAASLPAGDPRQATELDRLRTLAVTAQDELHTLVDTLRPVELAEQGLVTALRRRIELLRRVHDVSMVLTAPAVLRIRRPVVEAELFKVACEALSNALQHSAATHIEVTLAGNLAGNLAGSAAAAGGGLRLVVRDDGDGFAVPPSDATAGLGLASMADRMGTLGGRLSVDSTPGRGTTVTAEVPDV